MPTIHWRTEWNNYLQDIGKKDKFIWEEVHEGPEHRGKWIIKAMRECVIQPTMQRSL